MPTSQHAMEAAKILSEIAVSDRVGLTRARRLLAEALERAERRGREAMGRQKESSG
jgi:hypothetical protein